MFITLGTLFFVSGRFGDLYRRRGDSACVQETLIYINLGELTQMDDFCKQVLTGLKCMNQCMVRMKHVSVVKWWPLRWNPIPIS